MSNSGLNTVKCRCWVAFLQGDHYFLPPSLSPLFSFSQYGNLNWIGNLAARAGFLRKNISHWQPVLSQVLKLSVEESGDFSLSGPSPQAAGVLPALCCIACLVISLGSFGDARFDICYLLPQVLRVTHQRPGDERGPGPGEKSEVYRSCPGLGGQLHRVQRAAEQEQRGGQWEREAGQP